MSKIYEKNIFHAICLDAIITDTVDLLTQDMPDTAQFIDGGEQATSAAHENNSNKAVAGRISTYTRVGRLLQESAERLKNVFL